MRFILLVAGLAHTELRRIGTLVGGHGPLFFHTFSAHFTGAVWERTACYVLAHLIANGQNVCW